MKDEKPKFIFQKMTDQARNRMIIPKFFVDYYGRSFYMEVYDDYIKLIPMSKKEK